MKEYPPLQSHGIYDEEWVPPKSGSKLFSYDSRDTWLRYIGLGSIKRSLRQMYDVRLPDDTLCGYVKYDPSTHNHYGITFPVMTGDRRCFTVDSMHEMHTEWIGITIRPVLYSLFCCWQARSVEDAALLLESSAIVLGRDGIRDLQRKIRDLVFMHPMYTDVIAKQIMGLNVREIDENYQRAFGCRS